MILEKGSKFCAIYPMTHEVKAALNDERDAEKTHGDQQPENPFRPNQRELEEDGREHVSNP